MINIHKIPWFKFLDAKFAQDSDNALDWNVELEKWLMTEKLSNIPSSHSGLNQADLVDDLYIYLSTYLSICLSVSLCVYVCECTCACMLVRMCACVCVVCSVFIAQFLFQKIILSFRNPMKHIRRFIWQNAAYLRTFCLRWERYTSGTPNIKGRSQVIMENTIIGFWKIAAHIQ